MPPDRVVCGDTGESHRDLAAMQTTRHLKKGHAATTDVTSSTHVCSYIQYARVDLSRVSKLIGPNVLEHFCVSVCVWLNLN